MDILNQPSQWDEYCDERLVLGRCAVDWSTFEFIKVTDEDDGRVKVLHEVIFPDDYPEEALNEILNRIGHKDLHAFVVENATTNEWFYLSYERIDSKNSPAYLID